MDDGWVGRAGGAAAPPSQTRPPAEQLDFSVPAQRHSLHEPVKCLAVGQEQYGATVRWTIDGACPRSTATTLVTLTKLLCRGDTSYVAAGTIVAQHG